MAATWKYGGSVKEARRRQFLRSSKALFANHRFALLRPSLAAIFAFLLTVYIVVKLFVLFHWHEYQIHAQKLLSVTTAVHTEAMRSLTYLHGLKLNHCNSQNLLMMRRENFRTQYVKDIGFFDGNTLLCTSVTGVLEKPYTGKNIPDFILPNKGRVWSSVDLIMFDKKVTSIIFRYENYHVVLNKDIYLEKIPSIYQWQIVYQTQNGQHFYNGAKNLSGQVRAFPSWSPFIHTLPVAEVCDPASFQCVRVGYRTLERQRAMAEAFVIACIVGSIAALISGWLALSYGIYNMSVRRRVFFAIKNDCGFFCVYQPEVRLDSGEIIGVEVLARLQDRYGSLSPDEFIPIVADLNMTWTFTQAIVRHAMNDLATLPKVTDNLQISINIFPRDMINTSIRQFDKIDGVAGRLKKIVLEITENEYLESSTAQENIRVLNAKGITIAIDDFGKGYSNLHLLKNMGAQILKIDRQFISEIDDEKARQPLIEHIIAIAHDESMKVIVEGVETPVQNHALQAMGADLGQGWYFGKPMPIGALRARIEEGSLAPFCRQNPSFAQCA